LQRCIFLLAIFSLLWVNSKAVSPLSNNLTEVKGDSIQDSTRGRWWGSPGSVALRSAVIPGWGQVSNSQYWKVPLFYAAFGVCAYFIKDNHTMYKRYQLAYRQRADTSHGMGIDEFDPNPLNMHPAPEGYVYTADGLLNLREQYRQWRDLSYIIGVGIYAANILDAYVYAELKDFDVSENLSMSLKPVNFINIAGKNCMVSTINFRFKK
jgi:hypothetical protein